MITKDLDFPEQLIDALRQNELVIFVGYVTII
jgi:hypothetical protein